MSVGLDVCACVSNFFQIAISPTIFLRFLRHLAHVISVPLCNKTVEQFFKILLLQIFREFLFFIFFCKSLVLQFFSHKTWHKWFMCIKAVEQIFEILL